MSVREESASHLQDVSRSGRAGAARRPLLNDIARLLAFETVFYFSYRYGMLFPHTAASPFWFPDSILLCALLLNPPEKWWIYVLAPLPIRLFSDFAQDVPMWLLLGTYAVDSLKGLAAASALVRFLRNPLRLETIQEFGVFCLIAVVLVPGICAFGGAALRAGVGDDYWSAWE